MGIKTAIVDENGKKLALVEDPTNILHRVLPRHEDNGYQCLNRIDWYGDTTFNRHQLPVFREELRRVLSSIEVLAQRALLDQIDALAVRCAAEPHLYLKFIGD